MRDTSTIAIDPTITLNLRGEPTHEQRLSTINVYRSLSKLFEEMRVPERARYWDERAKALGWKDEWSLD